MAFTLIEMIGVLAIIALVAAAITPVVIRRDDLAALSKETADLSAISSALQLQILRTYTIPSDTKLGAVGGQLAGALAFHPSPTLPGA